MQVNRLVYGKRWCEIDLPWYTLAVSRPIPPLAPADEISVRRIDALPSSIVGLTGYQNVDAIEAQIHIDPWCTLY